MLDVLLAEDDEVVRESMATALVNAGHQVTEAMDGEQAAELVSSHVFDLAICDVHMPKLDGMALLRRIRREAPGTAVVMMTSYGSIPDVIGSLRSGAVDYVTKPFDPDEFAVRIVKPIDEHRELRKRFQDARARWVARGVGATLVALSRPMRNLVNRIAVLGYSDTSVLVTGDRGAGKELVARTLHAQGSRRDGPFVLVDGTLVPDLVESSDAWLREAAGGTLVLDGVMDLPLGVQARLLRQLSAPGMSAARSAGWEPVGVRLVTLSRESLADRVAAGTFLEGLAYRLNAVQLHVARLVERADDLCPLVMQLLNELEPKTQSSASLTPGAWQALASYRFPGNVRELRWALEHALAMADGEPIDAAHLPLEIQGT